ncbi:MAG TPA: hypothetical protein VF190_14330 [Rhodothermales bacterium]
MSPRTKSVLLIVATLLIGLVLGALLNARLAERRMERLASLRSERGFVRFMEEVVQPTDEAQREAMHEVFRRTGERMAEHQERSRRDAMAILDSSRQELAEILTPEQMQRLDDRLQDRRRHRRDGDFRRGGPRREFRGMPPADSSGD